MFQARKNFTFNGISYKTGDDFKTGKIPLVKLRLLEAARFIVRCDAKPKRKLFKSKKDQA